MSIESFKYKGDKPNEDRSYTISNILQEIADTLLWSEWCEHYNINDDPSNSAMLALEINAAEEKIVVAGEVTSYGNEYFSPSENHTTILKTEIPKLINEVLGFSIDEMVLGREIDGTAMVALLKAADGIEIPDDYDDRIVLFGEKVDKLLDSLYQLSETDEEEYEPGEVENVYGTIRYRTDSIDVDNLTISINKNEDSNYECEITDELIKKFKEHEII